MLKAVYNGKKDKKYFEKQLVNFSVNLTQH